MKNKKFLVAIALSLFVLVVAVFLSLMLGSVNFSPVEVFKILFGDKGAVGYNLLLYSRLPRAVASIFAGVALSLAGAVLQNVLANKLASPSIIGVNAGAGLGVAIACSLGIISGLAVSLFAFLGSLLAVMTISIFARTTSASKSTVILGGVALNSILNAFSESLGVLNPDVAFLSAEFRMGGFSSVSYSRLLPAVAVIIVASLVLFTLLNELDVLSLGDESAKSVGLSAKKYRIIFLVLASLLAGSAVSFCGLLGFVGLIVPHFARKIAGNESRYLLPLTALMGGAFVCVSELIARFLFTPYELPVGMLMAIIGAPLFIFILVGMKGGARRVKI